MWKIQILNLFLFGVFRHDSATVIKSNVSDQAQCHCGSFGKRNEDGSWLNATNDRIINGDPVPLNAFPYQVGIFLKTGSYPFCGGTLISQNFVLTAAHCMKGVTAEQLRVSLNDTNYIKEDGEFYRSVLHILRHPSFNISSYLDNDFALLKLDTPVSFSDTFDAACLPSDPPRLFEGLTVIISGWGATKPNGPVTPDLRFAIVQVISNIECQWRGYGRLITSNMVCGVSPNMDTDTCQGDSGGPLIGIIRGRLTLIGVTSFGAGCANPPYPGVYARVTSVKNWILQNSDAGLCQN